MKLGLILATADLCFSVAAASVAMAGEDPRSLKHFGIGGSRAAAVAHGDHKPERAIQP